MPTHKASIDSLESIRHDSKNRFTTQLQPKPARGRCRVHRPGNRLSAAPTRDFMDGVPWRTRMEFPLPGGIRQFSEIVDIS